MDPDLRKSTEAVRVRFAETDLMGIVHHASYLLYCELGRVEWLRKRGVTYADWAAKGVHLPVVEANLLYRSPARFDDLLAIETRIDRVRSVSVKFTYRILRGDTLICEGHTRLACIDDDHKLFRIPEEMSSVLLGGEI